MNLEKLNEDGKLLFNLKQKFENWKVLLRVGFYPDLTSPRPTGFGSWIPVPELNQFAYFEQELYSVFRVYVPECLYFVHYANQILKILNIHIHVKGLLFVLFMEHAKNLSQRPLNVEDSKRGF